MNIGVKGVLGAATLLVSATSAAQDATTPAAREVDARAELVGGVFAHGVIRPFALDIPPGYEVWDPEGGTVDVQLGYRSRPLTFALKPRLTAKVQVNTGGKTSFASVGAEWRQHVLRRRLYGQIGIGLTIHDGYRAIPDPFDFAVGSADFWRRYELYASRTSFGSRVLFNPNVSLGLRLDRDWAVEAAWEHFSNNNWFGSVNDGMDTFGVRVTRAIGRRR